jgi:FkbM family methyltransferase
MSNLIYSAIFFNEGYLALVDLLLESYQRTGNTTNKYLIITSPVYKKRIQAFFDKYEIDGDIWCLNVFTQFDACCARLHIFSYSDIDKYENLLYLDCDVLITNPIDPIFDIQLEEKLYAMSFEDANVDDWGNGGYLFKENKVDIAKDRTTFSSCIMLFKNCERIKSLFSDIIAHIKERVPEQYDLKGSFDQDFIIYHCFIQDCYNNTYMNKFARNNQLEDDKDMILNHFTAIHETTCGTPDGKLDWMHVYLSRAGIEGYTKNFIHIGANVGKCFHEPETFQLFDIVSVHDHCVFVEPVPYLFKQLKENYNETYPGNNFIFLNKAVSNTIGETEMTIISEENDFENLPYWVNMISSINPDYGDKHLLPIDPSQTNENIPPLIKEQIIVPTTTLNEIIKEAHMTEIDILIVDAEGHDFEILIAYDFSILPKRIIFEHCHMKPGDLAILHKQLALKGYVVKGITELDYLMELR